MHMLAAATALAGWLLLIGSACFAAVGYFAGRRQQAFRQARADVRDARGKLRKARSARTVAGKAALVGWLLLLGSVLLLAVVGSS